MTTRHLVYECTSHCDALMELTVDAEREVWHTIFFAEHAFVLKLNTNADDRVLMPAMEPHALGVRG